MAKSPIGFRIRSERKTLGLTQAELAKQAGISPSYLNMIESNKREIGGALLNRLAELLRVDSGALSGRAERQLIFDLGEVAAEPLVRRLNLSPDSAAELVGRHPDWARAFLVVYRAWRDQTSFANALLDRLNQDPILGNVVHQMLTYVTAIRSSSEILDDVSELDDAQRRRFREIISSESQRLSETAQSLVNLFDHSGTVNQASTPADEVDDFLRQHNAWFPTLERAGDQIRKSLLNGRGTDEISLHDFLISNHSTTIAQVSPVDAMPRRYRNLTDVDFDERKITFLENAPRSTRRFQLARHIALNEAAPLIEAQLDDPLLTSDAARERARYALASYIAGALVFPYDEFLQLASNCRYDIEILRQRFDASFEQVCHRLVTLRKPKGSGVPFAFLRSDPAGHITKNFPLPRLPLLRHGHACPLWAIFLSFQTPNRPIRRLVEFPDGSRYLMVAQAVTKQPASFHEAPFLQSVMLVCDVLHAERTVYADGLDLTSAGSATPVGPSCRMCPRSDCRLRGEDSIVESIPSVE
ncbi:MAG: DUF2083 domain-containing protein [Hyphomicrobiales bacterium]|nr:DUF2083 domain-containing protein [Hyphomicrobiales bacterium]